MDCSLTAERARIDLHGLQQANEAVDAWTVATSSVRGTGHVHSGTPCQDHAACRQTGEALIIAVSDGAGSRPLSQQGAVASVHRAVSLVESEMARRLPITSEALQDIVVSVAGHVRELASKHVGEQLTPGDFACTLILAVVVDGRLWVTQVGDGAVVTSGRHGLVCLSPPSQDGYINETTFVTEVRGRQDVFVCEEDARDIDALAVMTDGVQHLGVQHRTNEPHPGLFVPLFTYVRDQHDLPASARNEDLDAFLESDLVNAETDDDKTLVVAVRVSSTGVERRPAPHILDASLSPASTGCDSPYSPTLPPLHEARLLDTHLWRVCRRVVEWLPRW